MLGHSKQQMTSLQSQDDDMGDQIFSETIFSVSIMSSFHAGERYVYR